MRLIGKGISNNLKKMDKTLLFMVLVLVVFGLLNIVTASSRETVVRYDQSLYHYFIQHSIMLIIAFIGSSFLINIPTKLYRLLVPVAYLVVLFMLVYLLINGVAQRGSINWISILGIKFQPSEFSKPILIIMLALLFETFGRKLKNKNIGHYDMIGWILVVGLLVPVIVFLQKDLGTSMIILGVFTIMFLASPILKVEKIKTFIFLFVVGLIGILGMIVIKGNVLSDTQMERFDFFNPCSKYEDNGYQICNGFIAINDGSLLGLGIGKSKQKYSYIPDPHTDSVFAVIAEEIGFLFSTLIVFIPYVIILWRILKISSTTSTVRGKYICLGVATYMFLHIFLNLGGLFAIIPLTGVPLPFLSYGGTFTISLICSLAVVQRIHMEANN